MKGKALIVIGGLGALLLAGVAMAAGGDKKKAVVPPNPKKEGDPTKDDIIVNVKEAGANPAEPLTVVINPKDMVDNMSKDMDDAQRGLSQSANMSNISYTKPVAPVLPTHKLTTEPVSTPPKVVEQIIKEAEKTGVPIQTIAKAVAATKENPLSNKELEKENDPIGTIALAKRLLGAESLPGWKTQHKDAIATWQRKANLLADGQFGIKSAAKMAEEVGILPLIRYWPKTVTSKAQGEKEFDAAITKVITMLKDKHGDISKPHRDALELSKEREIAFSFGAKDPIAAVNTPQFMDEVTKYLTAKAEQGVV